MVTYTIHEQAGVRDVTVTAPAEQVAEVFAQWGVDTDGRLAGPLCILCAEPKD